MITIIAIGKKHEAWIASGLERYEQRLKPPFDITWVLLPHSSLEGAAARHEESDRIRKRLAVTDSVILLDETGAQHSSPLLSERLERAFASSEAITFVIGGAYGVDDELKQRSREVMSLSKLVFPHQLVRLILVEQLYRSQQISRGSAYHHA